MKPQTTTRRATVALLVLVASALLSACGSSSSSSTTSAAAAGSNTTASGTSTASRTAFRDCLKAHGVTLPNRRPATGTRPPGGTPGAGGTPPGIFGAGGGGNGGPRAGGFAARNPKLAAALKACGGGRFLGAGRRFRLSRAAITKFVTCVRQHGYNLPAPNFSGKGPVFPANIRSNPKFVSASKACANLLVPARGTPPGTSGGAPPSTS